MRRVRFAGLLLSVVSSVALADSLPTPTLTVEKISAEDFGALPFMVQPDLSPDGRVMVARVFKADGPALGLFVLADKSANRVIPIPDKRDLLWYRWAGNDRVLISIGMSELLDGEDVYVTRLLMYDLKKNQAKFIGKRSEGIEGDDVIYVDRDGSYLLLNVQQTVYEYPAVLRIDLDSLSIKRIVSPRDHIWRWSTDDRGTVRAGLGLDGNRWWLLYRRSEDDKFEKVLRRKRGEDDGVVDRFVPRQGSDQGYIVANTATGRFGLYRYDFLTDTIGEAVYEHPQVDIDDFELSENGEVEAVYYVDDRQRVNWFDPKMKEIQSNIDAALPNRINRIVSTTRDHGQMIVWTGSASDPGRYYMFESTTGVMRLISKPYERLQGKTLAPVESIKYRARDGLEIPAYLTTPVGVEIKNLPLIVMPHGGPFARDEWSYDAWAQFLANRGYIVIQPNFRGSTGYGKAYVDKGQGQWGRGMQDDVDDAVKALVDQGKADSKRVCIMGASFGGYAAMWAAARNPDLYRCAISFAGVSDVKAMLRYQRSLLSATRYYPSWRETVQGDKDFDLDTISPLRAVDRITIPLLIAHGDADERVPPSQSRKMHDALAKAGKQHVFVMYENEKHGFSDPKNATDFLKRVESFLETHNPAGTLKSQAAATAATH
jgi:dipeptidyl aminopeptidase/acylaminoacyl peptidase